MPSSYPSREFFEQDHANVKGTALGPDRDDEFLTLIVLVTRKYDESELDPDDVVPETVTIDGTTYVTDVVPVGIPHALALSSQDVADYRARHRPIPGGVSIGNDAVGAGTMGSPLLEHDGDPVVLTNSHVGGGAHEQFQPSQLDGGGMSDDSFGTLRETSELNPRQTQTTDSALIDVDPDLIDDTILGIGPLAGIDRDGAEFGRTYYKAGRTTGVTRGELRGRDVQVDVAYGADTIRFTGCDLFGAMSTAGDSGSLIGYPENDDFRATDLLFAGSDQVTIGVNLSAVEEYHGSLTIPENDEDDTDTDVGGDETPRSWGQFHHNAALHRVVDGDTMDFKVHLGPLDLSQDHRIRLLEIDTAERGTDDFDTHTQFATDWLDTGIEEYGPEDDPDDPGTEWPFVLETYRDELDSFGRLLTDVRRKSDGERLRDAFLAEYGEPVRYNLDAQLAALLR